MPRDDRGAAVRSVVVVGGGIIGLATAHRLLEARPGLDVVVLERLRRTGLGQSSRNSGVLHAGLYYPPGSAKAVWSRRGKAELERFCDEHDVPVVRCGKLVVAVERSELEDLRRLGERARANGVDVSDVSGDECRAMEPEVSAIAGILSPNTAVTDFGLVCAALERAIASAGGTVLTGQEVLSITDEPSGAVRVETMSLSIAARAVVACAGLQADRLAGRSGITLRERIVPFRGNWLRVRPARAGIVRRNIYPVPRPGLPFLGVHLTPRIGGEIWIGPNAVMATARDGAHPWSIAPRDLATTLAHPGTWRLARREWRAGVGELVRDLSLHAMMRTVRRYVPSLEDHDVEAGPWGVRAQLLARDGRLVDDFRIERHGRVLHVLNAPSPAATACLAIGARLRNDVLEMLGA